MFDRGIFLIGEYDLTGIVADKVLGTSVSPKDQPDLRHLTMLAELGKLVGKDRESEATRFLGNPVTTIEDLP